MSGNLEREGKGEIYSLINRQTGRHMITPQLTKWLTKSGATKPRLVYEGG